MQPSVFARRVRDYMTPSPPHVLAETPIHRIQRFLVDGRHHAVPVVDAGHRLIGTISSLELLRLVSDARDITTIQLPGSETETNDEQVTALDAMDPELIAVSPETTLVEAARLMHTQAVHRMFVVEAGVLVGAITTFDMLRAFTRGRPYPEQRIDLDPSTMAAGDGP
jgi:CBS domain-containing protein